MRKTSKEYKINKKIVVAIITIIVLIGIGYTIKENIAYREEQAKIEEMAKEKEAEKRIQEEKAKIEAEQKEKDRKVAHDKAIEILNLLTKQYDNLEEKGWYKAYGSHLPTRNLCTWYVGENNGKVWMRGILAFKAPFGLSIIDGEIKKVLFASSAGKYALELRKEEFWFEYRTQDGESFKSILLRDNYIHSLDCSYDILKPGFEVLAKGSNPVIRYYYGDAGRYDVNVEQEDINLLGKSLELYECFQILDNKL